MRGYSTLWPVIVDCIVLHYMHICHLRIRASKINMSLARMDKLVKKLMSNPVSWWLVSLVEETGVRRENQTLHALEGPVNHKFVCTLEHRYLELGYFFPPIAWNKPMVRYVHPETLEISNQVIGLFNFDCIICPFNFYYIIIPINFDSVYIKMLLFSLVYTSMSNIYIYIYNLNVMLHIQVCKLLNKVKYFTC